MPFSFKESDYQNTFPAEVIESVMLPSPNDPTKEMWQLTLLRLRYNASKGTWESMETPFPCQLPGCTIQEWHTHTRFYESDRSGSPSHKFILSISRNTNIALMSEKDILNKRFTWTEEIWQGRPNPTTGTKGKDSYYYFIKGELGAGAPANAHVESDELPFDSGQPTTVITQPVVVNPEPVVVNTTNGTATATERDMTVEDATILLLPEVDGKTKAQIQQIVMSREEFRKTPGFLVQFMQNKVRDNLVTQGFITEDEQGVWHISQS